MLSAALGRAPSGRMWVIGDLNRGVPGAQPFRNVRDLEAVLGPHDEVLISLDARTTIEAAERLLAEIENRIYLDSRDRPGLHRAFGTSRDGIRCVPLRARRRWPLATAAGRVADVVLSLVGSVLSLPLVALAATAIRVTSPGPIFYTTTVVGRNGTTFTWRKLRTMRVQPDDVSADRQAAYRAFIERSERGDVEPKVIDRSRVTAVGAFLRKHSLDELPQLWNVFVGDMAMVGPRPCLRYEYELQAPWQQMRYRVKPGLTGAWQVYGRGRVSFDEMILIDYCYLHSRSLALDLRLIASTVIVVLTGRGGL